MPHSEQARLAKRSIQKLCVYMLLRDEHEQSQQQEQGGYIIGEEGHLGPH